MMVSRWLVVAALVVLSACGKSVRTTRPGLDDATIATRVTTALLNDPDIGARQIEVTVVQGVVTLSGTVTSPAEETRAIEVTRSVPGVRDVRSVLRVVPAAPGRLASGARRRVSS